MPEDAPSNSTPDAPGDPDGDRPSDPRNVQEPESAADEFGAPEQGSQTMSFGSHLEELRRRIIVGLFGIAPIFVLTLIFGDELLEAILRPAQEALRKQGLPPLLIATNALEVLGAWLKVAGVITIVLGVPILLWQLWLFVAPGLYEHEKRFARLLVPLSGALSLIGLLFLYFVMLPAMLTFLIGFGTTVGRPGTSVAPLPPGIVLPSMPVLEGDPPDPQPGQMWINRSMEEIRTAMPLGALPADGSKPAMEIRGTPLNKSTGIAPQLKVSEYVGLVFVMSIAFAVGFQTPVVVLILGWVGLVDVDVLRKSRRYALVGCFVAAALLTPSPDPFNMTILAIPLYLLFELGLFLLRFLPPGNVARGIRLRDAWAKARSRG